MAAREVIEELLPPDLPRIVRYRLAVFLSIMAIWAALSYIMVAYAKAEDIEAVKGELKKQIEDVDAKVENVNRKVDQTNANVNTILKLSIQTRVRALQEQRCENHHDDRLRRLIQREIDELQNQHVNLTGYVYQLEEC